MKRSLAVPAGIGLLLLAFGVAFSTPASEQIEAPFASRGAVGDRIVAGEFVATVHEVSLAQEVEVDSWLGTTSGVWLVVDATITGTVGTTGIDAELRMNGVRYPATRRAGIDTVDGTVVDAGFAASGPLLVELPRDVLESPGARSAVLRISPGLDARLDSVVELVLDLTTLEVADSVELEPRRDGDR